MKHPARLLWLLLLLFVCGPAQASILAVLEISGAALPGDQRSALTDAIRQAAVNAAMGSSVVVMTQANMEVMLSDMGLDASCISEGACEVDTLRTLNAEYGITGKVVAFGDTLLVTVQLYETSGGTMLGSKQVKSSDPMELLETGLPAATTELMHRIPGLGGVAVVAEPQAVKTPRSTTALQRSPTLIGAGGHHSCALNATGHLQCWGDIQTPSGTYTEVSSGGRHSCAIESSGAIRCWGNNVWGQSTPPSGSFLSVSAGKYHSCGVDQAGQIQCWGAGTGAEKCNGWGKDGSNWQCDQSKPPAGQYVQVSAGLVHSCAVAASGEVACWGAGAGQNWGWSAGQASPPTGLYVEVSAGGFHSCGLRQDGTITCWGKDTAGSPVLQAPGGTFRQVSAGDYHNCAVTSDDAVKCWGGKSGTKGTPGDSIRQVSSGAWHSCAQLQNGRLRCWGDGLDGSATPP